MRNMTGRELLKEGAIARELIMVYKEFPKKQEEIVYEIEVKHTKPSVLKKRLEATKENY